MNSFSQFDLPEAIHKALKALDYKEPTPVQTQAIPAALSGKDIIATAQTGTGKTAAFSIPIATQLLTKNDTTALVIAPTRELAQQIEATWRGLTKFCPELRVACIMGGASYSGQLKQLARRPRLIIATPGRLVDHLQQRTVNMSKVSFLVLDEADRMLDMGFAPQLNQIMRMLPKTRQTLLFSATWENSLDQLSKKYLNQPVRIAVGATSRAAGTIEQTTIFTNHREKNDVLLDELNSTEGSVLIFVRTKIRTDKLARYLYSFGLKVGCIHGGRTQGQRNTALASFRDGKVRILVATDVAARGIDVADIAHVINYDLPQVPEDYIHRIGRTGRAGTTGKALSLLTPEDRQQWSDIAKFLKKTGSTIPTPRKIVEKVRLSPVAEDASQRRAQRG